MACCYCYFNDNLWIDYIDWIDDMLEVAITCALASIIINILTLIDMRR